MNGLRAHWNGVTGHVISEPDPGQVIPEAMQRAKHLALAAIQETLVASGRNGDTMRATERATETETDL